MEDAFSIFQLGAEEAAEGLARMTASAGMAATSSELAAEGETLAAQGLAETEAGLALGDAAREMAVDGVGEVAQGAAELGAASVLEADEEI